MNSNGRIDEKFSINEFQKIMTENQAKKIVSTCSTYDEDHCEAAAKIYDCVRTQLKKL
jgi:hypothetical protein